MRSFLPKTGEQSWRQEDIFAKKSISSNDFRNELEYSILQN